MKEEKEIFKQWQTARAKALSEMFNNPDAGGVYPTSKFFNRIDGLFMGYLTKYTQSKLSKIVKKIESLKKTKSDFESKSHNLTVDVSINVALDAVIKIIKRDLTKTV